MFSRPYPNLRGSWAADRLQDRRGERLLPLLPVSSLLAGVLKSLQPEFPWRLALGPVEPLGIYPHHGQLVILLLTVLQGSITAPTPLPGSFHPRQWLRMETRRRALKRVVGKVLFPNLTYPGALYAPCQHPHPCTMHGCLL